MTKGANPVAKSALSRPIKVNSGKSLDGALSHLDGIRREHAALADIVAVLGDSPYLCGPTIKQAAAAVRRMLATAGERLDGCEAVLERAGAARA